MGLRDIKFGPGNNNYGRDKDLRENDEVMNKLKSFVQKSTIKQFQEELNKSKEEKKSDVKIVLELTKEEAKGLLNCLGRTMAKGDNLTIGMEIENRLVELLKQ